MLLPQKKWVHWIRTRWEKITISKIHILKKNRKAEKHNFFTWESYSKASGISSHILSKYHNGFHVAHRETTKPIPINNKHKRYQTFAQVKSYSNQRTSQMSVFLGRFIWSQSILETRNVNDVSIHVWFFDSRIKVLKKIQCKKRTILNVQSLL